VTTDAEGGELAREVDATVIDDPGGGQGPAVAAALFGLEPGAILIVNADVPCVLPDDLRALLAATPAGGIALVEALDGHDERIEHLPRPTSLRRSTAATAAVRFQARARELGLEPVSAAIPNLADDVDTVEDLAPPAPSSRAAVADGPRDAARGGDAVKVAVLSGGVGGARFVRGLVDVADPHEVVVIGNVGDDLDVLGMPRLAPTSTRFSTRSPG